MKENLKAIILILLIIFVILATSWNAIKLKIENKSNINKFKKLNLNLISTIHPELKDYIKELHFTGKVEPKRKINIVSPIDGEIEKIFVQNGDYVKKGEILFKIGGKIIDNDISLLQTKIKILNEKISIAKKLVNLKKLSFSKKLIKKDELLSSEIELFNLKSNLKILKERLNKIRKIQIITAPINGIFIKNFISAGQMVNKGDFLGKIISTNELKIVGKVFIADTKILLNKIVKINSQTFKIDKILPFKDSNGATIFWISDKNLSKYFSIGEFVEGKIEIIKNSKIISIPEKSIIYDENGNAWVFVKNKKNFRKVKVDTGLSQNGWVQVLSGINKSDEIVVNGAYELYYRNFVKNFKVED